MGLGPRKQITYILLQYKLLIMPLRKLQVVTIYIPIIKPFV